jgi:hypothetical protein
MHFYLSANQRLNEKRIHVMCFKSTIYSNNVIYVNRLIVACKFHPTPIVLELLEYIAPCRPVVVYSQYKEV